MKKRLIATAVASTLSMPAIAQNVTVYGLIDAGYLSSTVDHGAGAQTKQKAIGGVHSANGTGNINGSRLGVRGSEDLGGGLKAGFVYEVGINYSPGQAFNSSASSNDSTNLSANAALFGNTRQAFLELSGGFGSLRIGTQDTLAKVQTESIDPMSGASITGAASLYQAGLTTRRDAFTYQTPEFSGFSARGQIYLGESTSGGTGSVDSDNKGHALSVQYAGGPLRVAASGERIKRQTYFGASANRLLSLQSGSVVLPIAGGTDLSLSTSTASQTSVVTTDGTANMIDKVDFNSVGASYNFGPLTVHALASQVKFKDSTAADNGKISSQLAGVTVPLGNGVTLRASVSKGEMEDEGTEIYKLRAHQAMVQYDLSKRTNAYVAVGQTKYDSITANSDVKVKHVGIGIRHTF